MTMISEVKEQITIPEGVTAQLENNLLKIKGEKGEISRVLTHPKINIKLQNNTVEIHSKNVRRREKVLIGTFASHIKNMIKGVAEGYEYNMKTVF